MSERAVGRRARPPVLVLASTWLALAAGCSPEPSPREVASPVTPADTTPPARDLSAVLAEHAPRIAALPGVAGIGESRGADGRPVIRVFVERRTPELDAALPESLGGFPVEIEESGPIRALPGSDDRP